MITWVFYEKMLGRKMSAIGACNGAVVGLVAITPAAGFVNIGQSTFIGFVTAMVQACPTMPDPYWEEPHIKSLINKFPEGQVVIKINNELAG